MRGWTLGRSSATQLSFLPSPLSLLPCSADSQKLPQRTCAEVRVKEQYCTCLLPQPSASVSSRQRKAVTTRIREWASERTSRCGDALYRLEVVETRKFGLSQPVRQGAERYDWTRRKAVMGKPVKMEIYYIVAVFLLEHLRFRAQFQVTLKPADCRALKMLPVVQLLEPAGCLPPRSPDDSSMSEQYSNLCPCIEKES